MIYLILNQRRRKIIRVKCPIPKCGKDYPLNILPYPKTTCEHMSPDLINEINRLKKAFINLGDIFDVYGYPIDKDKILEKNDED